MRREEKRKEESCPGKDGTSNCRSATRSMRCHPVAYHRWTLCTTTQLPACDDLLRLLEQHRWQHAVPTSDLPPLAAHLEDLRADRAFPALLGQLRQHPRRLLHPPDNRRLLLRSQRRCQRAIKTVQIAAWERRAERRNSHRVGAAGLQAALKRPTFYHQPAMQSRITQCPFYGSSRRRL